MTAKRFVNKGKHIFQYGEWWCSANGEHCADVIATAINELIEENKQLKAQLFYDGDGVCNICKHQCLVKAGRYYVTKCKKEHEECSKIDLNYCDDFELKGDDLE